MALQKTLGGHPQSCWNWHSHRQHQGPPLLDPISFLQLSALFLAAKLAVSRLPESGAGLCQAPGWRGQAEAVWVPWTLSSQRLEYWEVVVHS